MDRRKDFFLECERNWCFLALIFSGGFYGAYTYCVRGGVFCNAQTANVVLFSIAVGNGNWSRALYLLLPMSAYLLGTIVSEILGKEVKKIRFLRWDTILVGLEIPVVIILAFLPKSVPDQVCQVTLNFICSMQFNTFRQNEGIPMATTFVTNHIRQIGSCLVRAWRGNDKEYSRRWKMHTAMVLMFMAGGIVSSLLTTYLNLRALVCIVPVLLYCFIRLAIADTTYERGLLGKKPHGH